MKPYALHLAALLVVQVLAGTSAAGGLDHDGSTHDAARQTLRAGQAAGTDILTLEDAASPYFAVVQLASAEDGAGGLTSMDNTGLGSDTMGDLQPSGMDDSWDTQDQGDDFSDTSSGDGDFPLNSLNWRPSAISHPESGSRLTSKPRT